MGKKKHLFTPPLSMLYHWDSPFKDKYRKFSYSPHSTPFKIFIKTKMEIDLYNVIGVRMRVTRLSSHYHLQLYYFSLFYFLYSQTPLIMYMTLIFISNRSRLQFSMKINMFYQRRLCKYKIQIKKKNFNF